MTIHEQDGKTLHKLYFVLVWPVISGGTPSLHTVHTVDMTNILTVDTSYISSGKPSMGMNSVFLQNSLVKSWESGQKCTWWNRCGAAAFFNIFNWLQHRNTQRYWQVGHVQATAPLVTAHTDTVKSASIAFSQCGRRGFELHANANSNTQRGACTGVRGIILFQRPRTAGGDRLCKDSSCDSALTQSERSESEPTDW